MRTRSRILVTLLAALVGLAGAEGVLRLFHVGPIPQATNEGTLTRPSENKQLAYENRPGATMRTRYRNRRGDLLQEVVANINEQGFRGPLLDPARTPGSLRIACLGDSQTFGHGVADDEPWPAVLSAILAARNEDRRVEVLNCGVAGYETEQEVAQLEERIGAFDPDLVLLGFFMNDTVLPNAVIQQPDGLSSRWIKILAPSRKPQLLPWLRRHLRIVDLGADWLFRRLVMRRWIGERELLFADDFVGWTRAQAAILRAREVVEGRGGRFVLLLVPLLMTEGDEILTTSPYRKVSAFCRAQDIRYYDPEPLFAGMEVDRMRVHPRDLHSTAEGHRIIALGLGDWLQEQGLLEPRR